MAQDDAIAIYFVILAVGHNRADTEKRCLEQPLGFVIYIYIYTNNFVMINTEYNCYIVFSRIV